MRPRVLIGLSGIATFVVVTAGMVAVMPKPLGRTDALLVGTVATMATLAVLFVVFMRSTHQRDVFFKRRPKK